MNRISYHEMVDIMTKANESGENKEAVIVFTEDSFSKDYSVEQRSYVVSSNNKMFNPEALGSSLSGDCLDGTDNGVRLDWYIGKWHVEYCYIKEEA